MNKSMAVVAVVSGCASSQDELVKRPAGRRLRQGEGESGGDRLGPALGLRGARGRGDAADRRGGGGRSQSWGRRALSTGLSEVTWTSIQLGNKLIREQMSKAGLEKLAGAL